MIIPLYTTYNIITNQIFIYIIYTYIYIYMYHRSIIYYIPLCWSNLFFLRRVCSGNPAATTAATFGLHPVRSVFFISSIRAALCFSVFLCAPCFRLVPLGSGSLATCRKSTALHVNQMHMLCTCSCQCYCLTCLMFCQFCHIL